MNLVKNKDITVDIEGAWVGDELLIRLTEGNNVFQFPLDDIDLEHFIATLIEFQR
jgi:uncharacterized protein (DUF427 family)|tara:strand:+ start:155 stop:319 length:165 start_codon:yes stop_codon:yes gene_type:complete